MDLLTWKVDDAAQTSSLWESKDTLQRSELAGIINDTDCGRELCVQVSTDATAARVMAVMFCHTLAEIAGVAEGLDRCSARPQAAQALMATTAGVLLLERLVAVVRVDAAVQAAVPFKGSDVHRKKVRLWQGLAVLAAFSQAGQGVLKVDDVIGHLKQPELASVKQYQETGGHPA